MTTIRQYTFSWGGRGHTPKYAILHAKADTPVLQFPTAWRTMIDARKQGIAVQEMAFLPEVRLVDDVTGALVGTENMTPPAPVVGTGGPDPLPDASQVLLRFNTGSIANGRRIKGRCFIPGVTRDAAVLGNNADVVAWRTAGVGLVGSGLVVWSRTAQLHAEVNAVDCWAEFATQRRRRG